VTTKECAIEQKSSHEENGDRNRYNNWYAADLSLSFATASDTDPERYHVLENEMNRESIIWPYGLLNKGQKNIFFYTIEEGLESAYFQNLANKLNCRPESLTTKNPKIKLARCWPRES
jgi:hypothetical protein